MEETANKSSRVLKIFLQLQKGKVLSKKELTEDFHVSARTIERDLEEVRDFFAEQHLSQEVVFDTARGGYCLLDRENQLLTNSEILAVCKILLESRSLRRDEMLPLLDRLVEGCVPESNKAVVKELLRNEKFHYIEPRHGKPILDRLWELGMAVKEQRMVQIEYERLKEPKLKTRLIEPVGIMFSEYYFYLVAFLRDVDRKKEFANPDDISPTIYRIDRIRDFKVLKERFFVPYRGHFEEGEFRKRVQFMYGGDLERVRFKYTGPSIEAVLDRLPTAQAKELPEGGWEVQAEVFGKGIDMWMKSQGKFVEVIV